MTDNNTTDNNTIDTTNITEEISENILPDTESNTETEINIEPNTEVEVVKNFTKNDRNQKGGSRRSDNRGPKRESKPKPEFDQKIVDIRRVTRVTSGGRKFSFAVAVIAGDKKGRIGFGTGKGLDTAMAVDKAYKKAKLNMIRLPLTKTGTIPHDVSAKYSSAQVEIRPAPGKGIVAGSSVRDVIEMAGIKDVIGKLRSGTKNPMNNAKVVIKALSTLSKSKKVKHTK